MSLMQEIEHQLREIKHSLTQIPNQITGIYKELERLDKQQFILINELKLDLQELYIKIDGDENLEVKGLRKRLGDIEIAYQTGQKFWYKAVGFFMAFGVLVAIARFMMWIWESFQKIK